MVGAMPMRKYTKWEVNGRPVGIHFLRTHYLYVRIFNEAHNFVNSHIFAASHYMVCSQQKFTFLLGTHFLKLIKKIHLKNICQSWIHIFCATFDILSFRWFSIQFQPLCELYPVPCVCSCGCVCVYNECADECGCCGCGDDAKCVSSWASPHVQSN